VARVETPDARDETAFRIASALLEGFDRHYRLFRATSAAAKQRFERADWRGMQRAVAERVRYYDERVREAVERLRAEFDPASLDDATWHRAKLYYIGLLVDYKRPELAETFFNSVTTRVLGRTYMTNDLLFVRATISTEYIPSDPPIYRSYYPAEEGLRATFLRIFRDFRWSRPFEDLERDVGWVLRALLEHYGGSWPAPAVNHQVQVLSSAFYRNKAAYVIGKIVNGDRETPFLVPVVHRDDGTLALDTVLFDPEELAVVFSLSRAYFMVDMDVPSGYVDFLRSLMPTKPRSELYTAIGLGKQGKTLFYRDLLHHLHHSQDRFVEAPGTRGQVMHVFNLPSYPYVFKVIKDRFGPAKQTDRATVMRKFAMLKDVDRVGRMVDAVEFENLVLPASRFDPELLRELLELAPSTIEVDGDSVTVRHCYVERRMTPLNIVLETASDEVASEVVREYGDAIRELAIANIFPGDMLLRNFGLTRYGRVVFYDYDEIEYLTDCTFRKIPPPPTPEAELAGEPWYGVGPRDVFPEEWASFLLANPKVREPFLAHHADLLTAEFWRECQRRVASGEVVDFFPYPESVRFASRYAAAERPAVAGAGAPSAASS
jgi:isocitrate dehydrogenase kinase/phosphatase